MPKIPSNIKHIHLIAVGGTGMGSLAGMLMEKGFVVTGSDQNIYPPMSTELEALGILLMSGYSADNLKKKPDLVIVGNAVSKTNPEVLEMQRQNLPYCSMPEALSHFFMRNNRSIVVAGTHGKTTTTAIISHFLLEMDSDPSYLVGGVLQGNQKNYRQGSGPYFVIEGDEYDTAFFDKGPKFLHYKPYYTLVTSLEFDHADIYRDLDHLTGSFVRLLEIGDPKGFVLACTHYPRLMEIIGKSYAAVETYGTENNPQWKAGRFSFEEGKTIFDILYHNRLEIRMESPLPGRHNILNVLAAFACLRKLGFKAERIQEALKTFKGIKRRQEVLGVVGDIAVIDDFAHHPTAVAETIDAVKKKYPGKKLIAVFEPRSNTSKRAVFQKDYAAAFAGADQVILADVFMPEKVTDGKILDVERLAQDISDNGTPARHISGVPSIVSHIARNTPSPAVILIMSNGGFGGIHQKVFEALKKQVGA
ncbi:MAG: UDP-N-acetylmuramate--L-alanine ligase [Deltaproteobacteria bacterium]|nr:UDP-N-acetylmuramate--L-alanine ligase [Deltaproteobacteria bacterium]